MRANRGGTAALCLWLTLAGAATPGFAQGGGPPAGEPTPVLSAGSDPSSAAEAAPPADAPAGSERVGPHPLATEEANPAPAPDAAPPAPAAPTKPPESGPSLPTAEQIANKLAKVKAAGETDPPADELTPEQRALALADLAAAADARRRLDALAADRAAAEAAAEAVEAEAQGVRAEADAERPAATPEDMREALGELSDPAVVTERTKAENDRARLNRDRDNLAAALSGERREAERAALRATLKRAAEAAAAAEALDPNVPMDVAAARIARARLEKAAAAEALAAAEAEGVRAAAAAAVGLPALRRGLLEKKIAAAAARIAAADAELNRRAAERARELAAASVSGDIPPALGPLAAEVAALQEAYEKQVAKRVSAEQQAARTGEKLTALKNRWDRVAKRVTELGLSDAVSASLRRERRDIPTLDLLAAAVESRLGEIEAAMVAAADHRDATAALPPADTHAKAAERLLARAGENGLVGDAYVAADRKARELLDLRRELLMELAPNDGTGGLDRAVVEALLALQKVQKDYRDTAAGFAEYIDERVLWVRSGPALNREQLEAEIPVLAGWAAPDAVRAAVESTLNALLTGLSSPLSALALAGCGLLIAVRVRLRGALALWAASCRRKGSLDYRSTALALAASLLGAAAGPALLAWLAHALTGGWAVPGGEGGPRALPPVVTAAALGTAAAYAAAVWLPLALLRIATRRDGLADAHFLWTSGAVRRIQRQARWFAPPLLTAAALAGLLGSADPLHAGGGWERVAFAAACGLSAALVYRLFRPAGVVWEGIRKAAPESRSHRFRTPLCAIGVLGTAAPGALSVAGYHYTAGELARRALETFTLLIVVVLVRSAAVRWVTVSRRAMLYRGMQRRREEAAAREQAADPSLPSGAQAESPAATGGGAGSDAPSATAAELSSQTRALVTAAAMTLGAVALWFIWSDVLPALNKLDDVTFSGWTVRREAPVDLDLPPRIEGGPDLPGLNFEGPEKPEAVPTELKLVPISLWDLLVAAAAAGLTILAAKNLPGLLALSVFDRLPLDAGGRYAVSRLAGYVAVVVGVLFTAGRLGFEWENVQWLIAALTVGLGFGLQEIVANFVCGVIILFERPVRVGDVVTVDDITGVVSRIRIRATTITNWDRKEFIVPNKEFVTGRLLNWTLSDATNRIVIEVGVAYGSDTRRACALLLEAAAEAPLVLKDPPPLATFEGFGDSTLNLILRCYLPNLDQRLPVISELHATIDGKFRTAGIEIAFPQRDLHVRTLPAALLTRGGELGDGTNPAPANPASANPDRELRNGHPIAA